MPQDQFVGRAFESIPMPGLLPTRGSGAMFRETKVDSLTKDVEDLTGVREEYDAAQTQIETLRAQLQDKTTRKRARG